MKINCITVYYQQLYVLACAHHIRRVIMRQFERSMDLRNGGSRNIKTAKMLGIK